MLEPEETPFLTLIPKGAGPKATYHEVLADTLRKPRLTGTREGETAERGGNKANKRARFGAYLHRWQDSYGVTDIQQLISQAGGTAGVPNELDRSKSKTVRELKRDIESVFCSNQDTQGGSDDAMQARGAFKWLGSSQTPAIPDDYLVPAAQRLTSVTDFADIGSNSVQSVLKSLKSQKGTASTFDVIVGNDYAEDADNWTLESSGSTNTQRRVQMSSNANGEIDIAVRVFKCSFGTINLIPSEFLNITSAGVGNASAALFINPEFWYAAFLEELHSMDETPTSGGQTGYVKAVGGLFCTMPKGNAFVANTLN